MIRLEDPPIAVGVNVFNCFVLICSAFFFLFCSAAAFSSAVAALWPQAA